MSKSIETTYRITNSSGLQGPAWRASYETQAGAVAALRRALGWDEIVLSESFSDGTGEPDDDGWLERDAVCAYRTQDECDDDQEGAFAPRVTRWRRDVDYGDAE